MTESGISSATLIVIDSDNEEDQPSHAPLPQESWIGYPASTYTQQNNPNHPPMPEMRFLRGGLVEIFSPLPQGTCPADYLADFDSPVATSAGSTESNESINSSQPSTSHYLHQTAIKYTLLLLLRRQN